MNMRRSISNLVHHAEVSEKAIEQYLREQAKAAGCLCLKYTNSSVTGYPDRLLCLPYGAVSWVELKSKGQKPTKAQELRHNELRRLGHLVHVIDSREGVDELMRNVRIWIEVNEGK
jgi:hypothetical protein